MSRYLGVAAAAGLIAVIVKGLKKKATPVTTAGDVAEAVATGDRELTKLERANIVAGIKVEYEGDVLSVRTLTQITEAVLRFAVPKFVELTKEDRNERRAQRDNVDRYISLWDEYAQKLEEIIEKSQKEVLKELNLAETVFENSNSFHISQNNQELFMLHATLPQRLKSSLRATKTLTLEEFKTILRAQIDATNEHAANLKDISAKTKNPEEAAPIINNMVVDAIFSKYTVEEEDLFAAMQIFANDGQVQGLLMELQSANMRLIPMPEGLF